MPTKSDLTFDELLQAGLMTPPQPAKPPRSKTQRTKRKAGKAQRKRRT